MKFLALILLLITSACAPQFKGQGVKVATEFASYASNFERQSELAGRPVQLSNITIEFDLTLEPPKTVGSAWVLAYCQPGFQKVVTVNPYFWNGGEYKDSLGVKRSITASTTAQKEQVLFHELGHCMMGREHEDGSIPSLDRNIMTPSSIMNSFMISTNTYKTNYEYYMKELFQTNPQKIVYSSGNHGSVKFDETLYVQASTLEEPIASLGTINEDGTIRMNCTHSH